MNGISAGPIKTLAAAGIGGFGKILKFVEEHAPCGATSPPRTSATPPHFCSPTSPPPSAEVLYVDAGFSHVVAGIPLLLLLQISRVDLDVRAAAEAVEHGLELRRAVELRGARSACGSSSLTGSSTTQEMRSSA